MAINNKKRYRTIKFMFLEMKKYVKMDVNGIATVKDLKRAFSKFLRENFLTKKLEFSCKNKLFDQLLNISQNLENLGESDDSCDVLEVFVKIQNIEDGQKKVSIFQ